MLLRSAIVMLVMLNLGVGAWWLLRPPAQAAAVPSLSTEGPPLRLLDEAPPPPSVASVTAAPVPAPAEAQGVQPEPQPEEAVPDAVATVQQCRRFGPFPDAGARDVARGQLASLGIHGITRHTPAKPARGWKVAMPPQASREAAVALAERIRAAGYSDLYVMNEGTEANSIALGRYGSEEAARRREADLRSKGFAAQATPLGSVTNQAWLDARLPTDADLAGLARIASSQVLDCATLR